MTGTFTADGQVSESTRLAPGESLSYSLVNTFTGSIVLQKSENLQTWETHLSFTAAGSGTVKNTDTKPFYFRWRCVDIDVDGMEEVDYTLVLLTTDIVFEQFLPNGKKLFEVTEAGEFRVLDVPYLHSYDFFHETSEAVSTNDEDPSVVDLDVYHSQLTTSGSEGAEEAEVGDGTGVVVGHRKLITLATRTHASDSVTLDDANISQGADTITAVELDAAGEFILLEWQGASWEVIKASTGVVSVA